jgi:hypothetical protein
MGIQVRCPTCLATQLVDEAQCGGVAHCRNCMSPITVPPAALLVVDVEPADMPPPLPRPAAQLDGLDLRRDRGEDDWLLRRRPRDRKSLEFILLLGGGTLVALILLIVCGVALFVVLSGVPGGRPIEPGDAGKAPLGERKPPAPDMVAPLPAPPREEVPPPWQPLPPPQAQEMKPLLPPPGQPVLPPPGAGVPGQELPPPVQPMPL